MIVEFNKAKKIIDEGCLLCLKVADNNKINRFLDSMKEGKIYTAKIEPKKNKRSLDANAYMWVLCDKIAKEINSTKEDVYRKAIKDVGVFTTIPVREDAISQFIENWQSGGIGKVAEIVGDSKLNSYVKVMCYFGSSTYNTKEMSRLIDWIVEEAKELEIETLTPRELEQIKANWRNEK